jgi:energy-coupling factor transporter ATP-binding protein EcfA2
MPPRDPNEMPKVYVAKVATSVKVAQSSQPRDYALGPLTLIVGPSGSGKTAIVDSVALALTGESPTRGLGAKAANLKRALPESAEALAVTAALSSGGVLTWSLGRGDSKPVWSAQDGYPVPGTGLVAKAPGVVLSVADALDILLGYDKNRMLAILYAVPDIEVQVIGVTAALANADRDLLVRLEGALPEDGATITSAQLKQALLTVDRLARDAEKQSAACDTFRSVGMSGAEQVELEAMEKALSSAVGLSVVTTELSRVEKQLAAAQTEEDGLSELIEKEVPDFFLLHDVAGGAADLLSDILGRAAAKGKTVFNCPGCGERRTIEQASARHAAVETALSALIGKVQGYYEQWTYQADQVTVLEGRRSVLADLMTAAGANAASVDEARLAELRHRKASAALDLAAGVRKSTCTRWTRTLEALQNVLLDAGVRALPAAAERVRRRVNKMLPKGRACQIVCDERKVNVGYVRDKASAVPVGALSGSERSVLAAAFAVALEPVRSAPVSLLVVDEVMFDHATLKTALAGLSRAFDHDAGPTQIIVCTSEWGGKGAKGRAKPPAGWIILDIDEKEKKSEKDEEKEQTEAASPESTGEAASDVAENEAASPDVNDAASCEPPPETESAAEEAANDMELNTDSLDLTDLL